jgi:predicted nuclease with TOPRIM domain
MSEENRDYATLAEYDELKMINNSQRNSISTIKMQLRVANEWGVKLQQAVAEKDEKISRLEKKFREAEVAAVQNYERAEENERERIIAEEKWERERAENKLFRNRLKEKDAEIERLRKDLIEIGREFGVMTCQIAGGEFDKGVIANIKMPDNFELSKRNIIVMEVDNYKNLCQKLKGD